MKQYQFALLIITIILIIYMLLRFIKQSNIVKRMSNKLLIGGLTNKPKCKNANCINNETDKIEEFMSNTEESEYKGLVEPSSTTIFSINKEYRDRPLKDYVIKGSYNSAITGKYVNENMIKYILQRGCRFLDFEVLYIDKKPYVTYTTDNNLEVINTDNKILLDNIFTSVISQAFTQPTPNYEDPLFIHLRLKSKDNNIYKSVAKSIDAILKSRLYNRRITEETTLSDIMGKIVIIMDKTYDRKYKDYSGCDPKETICYRLPNYVHLESGSNILYLNTYTDILNQNYTIVNVTNNCDHCTDVRNMRIVVPDKVHTNVNNANASDMIKNHGCQIVTQRFYIKDENLAKYEKIFDDNKGGIVPLANMLDYLRKEYKNDFA